MQQHWLARCTTAGKEESTHKHRRNGQVRRSVVGAKLLLLLLLSQKFVCGSGGKETVVTSRLAD